MRIYFKLITVFLAFITIPVVFVSHMCFYNSKITLEKEIFSRLNLLADEETEEISSLFFARKSDLLELGRLDIYARTFPALNQFCKDRSNPSYVEAKKAIDRRFALFTTAHRYVDIMLTNMEGRVIYSYNRKHEHEIGELIEDKDGVFRGARTGIYVGDVHRTTYKNHPYTFYLAGLAYDGADKVIGLVCVEVDMDTINDLLQGAPFREKSGEVLLFMKTPDNKVMFLSQTKDEPGAILTKKIDIGAPYALPAQESVSGENGFGLSIDYRGKEVLSAWRKIPSFGWGLVTKIDKNEAFQPIERLRKLLLIIIFISILSAAFAALAIASSISVPIQELRKGTEMIGKGNLEYRVSSVAKDEVGQLSRAFDMMVMKLKDSTTSVENLNEEIAAHKKADEDLKNERAYKENTLNSISDVFYAFDKSGKLLFWNNAFRDVTGYSDAELQTMNPTDFFSGEDVRRIAIAIERIWKDGTSKEEANFVLKDGRRVPYEFTGSELKDGIGTTIGFSGTGRDLSERKRREEESIAAFREVLKSREILSSMLADNNEVREKLEQSMKRLEEAQAQLIHAEKMETVGRMASGVAHEVKNPLGIILQGINYFEDALPREGREDREILQMMKNGVKRADAIVRALLGFARTQEFNIAPQGINSVIETSVELVRHRFKLGPIESAFELGKGLPEVLMDRVKIEQVFVNLFNNAIDAMPNGGTLYVRSRASTEGSVIVEVEDTGVGMGEDIVRKIFDPFFTTKNRSEGTGLGLSIVANILEMHKGSIEVETAKGKGTKFTIVFSNPGEMLS